MLLNKKIRYGVTLVLLCVSGIAYAAYSQPAEVVVMRTEHGFEPSRIFIHKGDTVTFVSSATDFWPASDSHPTHTLYPEFDSTRALASGERWSFTFNHAGVWPFHDHLASGYEGTIFVEGEKGESTEACLKAYGDGTRPQCWEAELVSILNTEGLNGAFDTVYTWYGQDPEFRKNCHDVMHILGTRAYAEFLENKTAVDRPEVSYCGYGFYHGFMETMLIERGPGGYDEAREYCEAMTGEKVRGRGPCYHGIGHALLDSLPSKYWGSGERMASTSIAMCESFLVNEFERARCASGVYNALSNAYGGNDYNISFDLNGPIPVCATQKEAYQRFCYMEMGNNFIRNHSWDRVQSFSFINSYTDLAVRTALMMGYMDTETKRSINVVNLEEFAGMCMSMPEARVAEGCITGVLTGLQGLGEPGKEKIRMGGFCEALSDPHLNGVCQDFLKYGQDKVVK